MNFSETDYKTKTESLLIEGINIQLKCITNIDELYEKLIQKGPDHEAVKDEKIPYWCDLWPSAIALSRHLLRTNHVSKGISVLEIGCGLGLPGIVAGKLKANVMMTDYLPEAIEFAKQNWKLNNTTNALFQLLDWRNPTSSMAADVLLASDIAYEKRSFNDLLHAFQLLIKPGGIILMSEPNRQYARSFFSSLAPNGFSLSTFKYDITLKQLTTSIHVHEIRKKW